MLCEYGCGQIALHILKNGKNCCSDFYSQCHAIRKKNSEGLKRAYAESRKNRNNFTDEHRVKSNQKAKESAAKKLLAGKYNRRNEDIKKILFEYFGLKDECQECGTSEWIGKKLTLHLDHINGDRYDNKIENLRLLCPNCHSLTPTYCSNSNKRISEKEFKNALKNNKNIHQALKELKLAIGPNYKRAKRLLEQI